MLQLQFFRYSGHTVCCLLVTAVHSKFLQAESSIKIWLFHFLVWKQVLLRLELLLMLFVPLTNLKVARSKLILEILTICGYKAEKPGLTRLFFFWHNEKILYNSFISTFYTLPYLFWSSAFCMLMQKNWTLKVRCIFTWASNAARNKLYWRVWLYNYLVCYYSCLGAITCVHTGSWSDRAGCAYMCIRLLLIHNMSVSVNYEQEKLKFWESILQCYLSLLKLGHGSRLWVLHSQPMDLCTEIGC